MKATSQFLILLLLVTFFSCSEDPDDVNPVDTQGALTVDVSGAIDLSFEDDTLSAYTHAGLLIVKAVDADENNIWLLMDTEKMTTMVGDDTVARTDGDVQINFNVTEGGRSFSATSGVVTVTEYKDELIKGTFSFEATNFSNQSETISGVNGQFTG